MKQYQKPIALVNDELAEGVYAASGSTGGTGGGNSTSGDNKPGCDSIYMKGKWQAPDYSQWAAGEQRGYRKQFGCNGCRAFTPNGCGLQSHYVDSGYASSYNDDNGNRKPGWEQKGYKPDDPVTDWSAGAS